MSTQIKRLMYYPYLRAKQYELKALREFAIEHNSQKKITPILEPVKQQTNALELAIKEFVATGLRFALILNPMDGDFKHSTIEFDLWHKNESLNTNKEAWIPAFVYTKNNVNDIIDTIEKYQLGHVMIIFRNCMSLEDDNAWSLIRLKSVDYVVNNFGTSVSRRLRSQLKDAVENVIRLDDCFKSKVRNADYALEDDELFSEEPFFYESEGQFNGFSDFTTLASEYVEGGMLPYALAIHFSYKKNEEQLYVHHFVSDSNETNNDIRGKFREAARKIEPFYSDKPKTSAVEETISKANDPEGYPGLGYLKKLSIKNHLELILSL